MSKINKLRNLARALSPNKVDFSTFDLELDKLKKNLEETVHIQTVEDVSRKLKQFQKKIDFSPLLEAIETIRNSFGENTKELEGKIAEKTKALLEASESKSSKATSGLASELGALKEELRETKKGQKNSLETISKIVKDIQNAQSLFGSGINNITDKLKTYSTKKEAEEALANALGLLRVELNNRINNIGRLGGAMNRQIKVGGVDYLTRYTDINFIAGTNVSIAVANDDTNRRVNITISASGGSVTFETPVGDVDDTNMTFTVSNEPDYINVNGLIYTAGNGIYVSYVAGTITLNTPVGTGGFILSAYS